MVPAESLIIVTGLSPFLHHTKRSFQAQIHEAESLNETITTRLAAFLGREKPKPPGDLPAFDFKETVTLLDNPKDADQLEKTIGAFGDLQQDLALAVGTEVTRIHSYVISKIPRRVHETMAGAVPIAPGSSELYRFRRLWFLAAEPLSILDDLDQHALSRDQAASWADLFPETAKTLWPAVQEALIRKGGASEGWKCPRAKETLLRVLCKQETPSFQLAKALKPIYDAEAQKQAAQQQTTRAPNKVTSATESTPGQRLDASS